MFEFIKDPFKVRTTVSHIRFYSLNFPEATQPIESTNVTFVRTAEIPKEIYAVTRKVTQIGKDMHVNIVHLYSKHPVI